MAGYWLKLYTEIIDDPKYHRLSDTAKLGMVELMVVAKKSGTKGDLPDLEDICFYTRRAKEWWIPVIEELKSISFLVDNGGHEKIRKFEERQAPADGAERTRMSRASKQHEEYTSNNPVTKVSRNVTENRLKIKDSEEIKDLETEQIDENSFSFDPDILLYQFKDISKCPYIPGNLEQRKEWLNVLEKLRDAGVTPDIMARACDGRKVSHPQEILSACSKLLQEITQ